MKALVTGGGGFLGRYIVEQLRARGHEVRSFSRRHYHSLQALGVEQRRGDVSDAAATTAACEGIDTVFHTAAVAGIWGPWEHYHRINTVGTQNVINACRAHRVPRLVFTSSPSVVFDGDDQCGLDETTPYPQQWLCHYPHSKALAEQIVLQANDDRLMTCALRPHLIWGPRDTHLIPRLIARAKSGRLRQVGEGNNLVDMIYVENAASAHLQAAECLQPDSPVCGNAYFLSQGEPVNCWDWINEILALAKLPPVQKRISFRVAWRVGVAMEHVYHLFRLKQEPRMTRFLAAQLAKSHYYNIEAARGDFRYEASVSTAAGMEQLARDLSTMS